MTKLAKLIFAASSSSPIFYPLSSLQSIFAGFSTYFHYQTGVTVALTQTGYSKFFDLGAVVRQRVGPHLCIINT